MRKISVIVIALGAVLMVATALFSMSSRNGVAAPGVPRQSNATGNSSDSEQPLEPAPAERQLVDASNEFAFDLYNQIRSEQGNLFFSPYSITAALGMVYEGAAGETAAEIRNLLPLAETAAERHTAFAALQRRFNPENPEFELAVANALWAQQGYPFLPAYMESLTEHYSAEANTVDFQASPADATERINTWVAEQTHNRIPELFSQNVINDLTRLVLTNAIYFKGNWAEQFDVVNTKDAEFSAPDGPIQVPTMSQLVEESAYAEVESLQLLEMPYAGDQLAMLVVLPAADATGGLTDVEQMLTSDKLRDWRAQLNQRDVQLYLPRFTFSSELDLKHELTALGMTQAFDPDLADFSGMTGKRDLYIQAAVHKAFVEVNEEGTEATAATGFAAGTLSAPAAPPEFRADRPFFFLILDRTSGAILFIGRVENPLAS